LSLKTPVLSIKTFSFEFKNKNSVSSIKNERIRCFLLIQLKLETGALILETRVLILETPVFKVETRVLILET